MRAFLCCFAVLLLAGCGAGLTPSAGGPAASPPFSYSVPMDQQTGGSTVKEVVVTGSRIPKANLAAIEAAPKSDEIFMASPENDAFVEYNILRNQISTFSTGTISPSTFIVDASGNLDFTAAPAQNKLFRLQFSPTGTPTVVSCNLTNPANNGLTQLPNLNFVIADTKNHFNIYKWTVGLPCQFVHSFTNPDSAAIHSLTADAAGNIDFADSKHFGQLTPTGTFKVFYTPVNGSLLYIPEEIRFSMNRLVFTATAPSGTAGEVGEFNSSLALLEHYYEGALDRSISDAIIDSAFNIWWATGKDSLDVVNPSGILKTVTNPALPTTFQSGGVTVGADGQIYWDAANSNVLNIYNHFQIKINPTALSITHGTTTSFKVSEITNPFLGTVPTTFSFTNAMPTIAKILSVTQSAGQATVTMEGLATGTDSILVKDGTGANSTAEPVGVH